MFLGRQTGHDLYDSYCLVPFVYTVNYLFVTLGLYLFIYLFICIFLHLFSSFATSYGRSRNVCDGVIMLFTVVFVI